MWDLSYIDATLSSMNYDANKLPLGRYSGYHPPTQADTVQGKLSKATILKGFAALKVRTCVLF